MSPVGAGVIGLGFMGRTHLEAYRQAGARIVAVCDGSAERLTGRVAGGGNIGAGGGERLFDPGEVVATADLDEMLSADGLDVVSVCTPTDTHVEVARRVIGAGKHVLVEKPVALEARPVEELGELARERGVLAMPAMCMRFWPAWAWVKAAVEDGRYGAVRAARFERLGARPTWGGGFYEDAQRAGGAIFDLHIHDTDFVVHLFGEPERAESAGDRDHVTTLYRYGAGGPAHVCAQGGWLRGAEAPFVMRMLIEFERAVAAFELGREGELRVYPAGGGEGRPELSAETGWEAEVAALVRAVERGEATPPATMESAAASTRVVQQELASLRGGER